MHIGPWIYTDWSICSSRTCRYRVTVKLYVIIEILFRKYLEVIKSMYGSMYVRIWHLPIQLVIWELTLVLYNCQLHHKHQHAQSV